MQLGFPCFAPRLRRDASRAKIQAQQTRPSRRNKEFNSCFLRRSLRGLFVLAKGLGEAASGLRLLAGAGGCPPAARGARGVGFPLVEEAVSCVDNRQRCVF